MKRRLARECALKTLFMIDIGKNDLAGAVAYVLENEKMPQKEQSFCRKLVSGVVENMDELDKTLSGCLLNWQFERLAAAVRNILRIALYEMLYMDDVPDIVSINEAIELTKLYQDEEASRFVNGVLDRFRKTRIGDDL